jgi:hypothetical protein
MRLEGDLVRFDGPIAANDPASLHLQELSLMPDLSVATTSRSPTRPAASA